MSVWLCSATADRTAGRCPLKWRPLFLGWPFTGLIACISGWPQQSRAVLCPRVAARQGKAPPVISTSL